MSLRPVHLPLALRLSLGLALNFALVIALFFALPGRAGLGWEVLLTQPARERLLAIADSVSVALAAQPGSEWSPTLAALGQPYGVTLQADSHRGGPPRGRPGPGGPPPPGTERRPPPEDKGPPPFDGPPPEGPRGMPLQTDRAVLADMISVQRQGWQGYRVRIPMSVRGQPVDLIATASGIAPLLRLLGIADWVRFGVLALLGTALIWLPFAWRLTRAVQRLTAATRTIAEGRFDVRVGIRRRDELGQLAAAVNDMAARLERQLESQKQFVADVAHEVTAPLARLRVGLDLIEPRLSAETLATHRDLQEDAQQMSALLDELLLFSRDGQPRGQEPAERIELAGLLAEVLRQESAEGRVQLAVPAEVCVLAPRALLQRALANLVRNALRYGQTEVEVLAATEAGRLRLTVRDRGPGVPAEALTRLGEPFYRPEFARTRDGGGTGLGLAIVRRCATACGGSVRFDNREGGGFEAVMEVPAG